MDEDLIAKLAKNAKTFSSQMVQPAYNGVSTFFKVPFIDDIKDIDIALTGVPFDSGVTNRTGTRAGPREIRNQSGLVGPYNHQSKMSPFLLSRVADVGDVPFKTTYNLEESLKDIESFFRRIAQIGAIPVTAGGDHSITFPILKAIASDRPVGLVHFDSHCDTGPAMHGSGLQHGCPMRNAVEAGLVDPKRAVQIGIRGAAELLWDFSYQSGMRVIHIEEFYEMGWKNVVSEVRRTVGDGPVYVTFDIDCLDPAFAPGTGTPVVGGMTSFEAQQVLRGLRGLKIIGGDVVEVSPPYDSGGITALAGATMMFEILCLAAESPALAGSQSESR
ncbi:MAG TPA: agmatinase [Methanotrichaceae archaeon]|nr:agmatinase [Methanotrichaceae archaeon]